MTDLSAFPSEPPAEDDVYEIFLMCYARGRARRIHGNFVIRDMHDGPMPIDYNLWILRNRHRTIIVDTGFSERAALERERPLDFDPVEGLARIGIDAAEVEHVIITHLHFDHAGNIDRFPKARFHVQDAEAAFATGRCMCEAHLRMPFDVEDVVAFVRHTYAERVSFHDGDAEPYPGISLHVLPGHSKGIQAVRVQSARGPVLLASDVSHFYANFLNRAPFVLTIDGRETLASYTKMLALALTVDHIIPGHDPKVRLLYPSYEVGGIALNALHEAPRPHSFADLAAYGSLEEPVAAS